MIGYYNSRATLSWKLWRPDTNQKVVKYTYFEELLLLEQELFLVNRQPYQMMKYR